MGTGSPSPPSVVVRRDSGADEMFSRFFFMLLSDTQIENRGMSTQPMGCSCSNQAASGTLAAVRSSTTTAKRKTKFVKSLRSEGRDNSSIPHTSENGRKTADC